MNKKVIIAAFAVVAVSMGAFAGPHHGYHHHGGWGRGGAHFWPGFVGGVIGGAVVEAIVGPRPAPVVVAAPAVVTTPVVTQPVVVQQPVVTQPVIAQPVVQQSAPQTQNVWVEGRYVDQQQSNGSVVRVWQPGHYESVVIAQ